MQLDEHFKNQYIAPFKDLYYYFNNKKGFIVWRFGTGNNVELLHIKTFKKRQGYGKQLFKEMLYQLLNKPPYYSIFGFTRVDNKEAQLFYKALGFNIQDIDGIYADGKCKLFWASYKELCSKNLGD